MRIHLPRKRYAFAAVVALLVCYVLVMVLWVGRSPDGPADSFDARAGTTSTPHAPAVSSVRTPVPSGAPAGAALTSLPKGIRQAFESSRDANRSGLPARSVRFSVTSDAIIGGIGYLIANGKPPSYGGHWYHSPFIVHTVAYSGGLTSFVSAQAGPTASRITCTLFVDGKLAMRRTAHGAYSLVTCLG